MAGTRQPERTCVGCRAKSEKRALIRVVRGADGRISLDPTRRAAGRGAYVHPSRECVALALRKGAVARALRASLGAAEAARLVQELEGTLGEEA
jgi:predicted RNA-binding protein YlxR (DUF448 family)